MTRAKCGSNSGYHTHRKHSETPCEPCHQAHLKYNRAKYHQGRAQALADTSITLPYVAFADIYLQSPPNIQMLIERHIGDELTEDMVQVHDQYEEITERVA